MIVTGATADQKDLYAATAESLENWICRAKRTGELSPQARSFEVYSIPLSQGGFLSLISTGPANTAEYVLTFIFNFLGQIIWAMFTGIVCGIMATSDPQTSAFKVHECRAGAQNAIPICMHTCAVNTHRHLLACLPYFFVEPNG